MTFYNPIKAFFSNNRYPVTIQVNTTIIVNSIFLIGKLVAIGFLKTIGVQNQLPIRLAYAALASNKILKVKILLPHIRISHL